MAQMRESRAQCVRLESSGIKVSTVWNLTLQVS